MLWGARKTVPAPGPEAEKPGDDPVLHALLDLAGGLLRDYGRTALDVEQTTAETIHQWCENWAQHLLVGAPRPGLESKPAPVERRDYAGARRFFGERRREETAFVGRSLATLQKAVWSFIQMLDGLLVQGDDSDGRLKDELERLKRVAQGATPAQMLRQEVLGTVEEIGRLAQARHKALRERVDGLSLEVRALACELEVARQEGAIDPLTRLFNRKAFDERLEQAVAMGRLFGQTPALLMVDIDHFKVVNDSLGHVAGDAVLREVSDCLSRQFCVRSDFVARYGGEEFVALLWDTPLAGARAAADKLVSSVRASRIVIDGSLVPVTVSVGVAQSRPGEMGQAWVERADRALYSAKAGGRNRAVLADDDLGPPADSTAARVR